MANFNLNKVILAGRMTADPEIKQTPQGVAVTTFSVAVNRKGKDAPTDFINCVAWRNTADFICKYFKKGNSICVEGEIQVRSYDDKDKIKRYATEILIKEAYFVDSKNDVKEEKEIAPNFVDVSPDEDLPF